MMEIVMLKYSDFVKKMLYQKWVFVDKQSPHTITHNDTDLVSTYIVNKGMDKSILKITCPDNKNMTICGRNHCDVNYPPHFFSLRCQSGDGENLAPDTTFDITKYGGSGVVPILGKKGDRPILYRELSQTVGERFKSKEERHYFPMGIILYSNESLVFRVHKPDIDIIKIELFMQADIWEKGG